MAHLIISFSGRADGNCDRIARFIARDGDTVVPFRQLHAHPCADCSYECFQAACPHRADGVYDLYDSMTDYDRVYLIVPMYCGNPSALYFTFNERCQDYFMHNDAYEAIVSRLYIIGVYGSDAETPDFLPCLGKWFDCTAQHRHVLGLQRHAYGQQMTDDLTDVPDVQAKLAAFTKE